MAFAAKNLAMSFTYGCFGLLLPVLADEFDADVSVVALGIGLVSLVMGLSGPLVGFLLDRWSMRGTVAGGCVLAALGFGFAANTQSILQFVLVYGVVAGLGATAMGSLPATKLAAAAFPQSEGKAIGFAMLPLSSIAAPIICAPLLATYGLRPMLLGFAAILIALAIAVPALVLQHPQNAPVSGPTRNIGHEHVQTRHSFVWLAVTAALLLPSGIALLTYIAPYARELGAGPPEASFLLALTGGMAVPGAYLFAWLSDWVPPAKVIALNAALQAILWLALAAAPSSTWLWLTAALLGLCAGGANPAFSVYVVKRYGQHRLGVILGRLSLTVVWFTFAVAPLVGLMFDIFEGYHYSWLFGSALCVVAMCTAWVLHIGKDRTANRLSRHIKT